MVFQGRKWVWAARMLALCWLLTILGVCRADRDSLVSVVDRETKTVRLTGDMYRELLGPRNYTMVLLFTALDPKVGCVLCGEFQPEYSLVAQSFYSDYGFDGSVLFVSADFLENREFFSYMGVTSVPYIFLYGPTTEFEASPKTDDHKVLQLVEGEENDIRLARFLTENMDKKVIIHKPFETEKFLKYFGFTLGCLIIIKRKGRQILQNMNLKVELKRIIFSIVCPILISIFTAGQMFNVIRGAPFLGSRKVGEHVELTYFIGGFQQQLGVETVIVGGTYLVLASLVSSLVLYVPRISRDSVRNVVVIALAGLIFVCFSALTCMFKRKDGGYPYVLWELL